MGNNFSKNLPYNSRETKAKFVYEKYKDILKGKLLDVGADELHLKKYLPNDVIYKGIGLGNNPALIKMDLEKENIPFADNSFDCVLCLDVLEHLENLHEVFDDLCRISNSYVIISLPNAYRDIITYFKDGKYMGRGKNTKFYSLPKEKEQDRHKWFFSSTEAKEFVEYRAKKNSMTIENLYIDNDGWDGLFKPKNLKDITRIWAIKFARRMLFKKDFYFPEIYEGTLWWVLKKND